MEQIDLNRYEVTGILGSGADYEARSAVDRETGAQVVLKRPEPQMIRRRMHVNIEGRTDRVLRVYEQIGKAIPAVVPIIGYTDRANHDAYFGDDLGNDYRVFVCERALGIPLVGDIKARFTGVPIGVGQHLFTLFPLIRSAEHPPFAIHEQLMEIEEQFFNAGYILLDLRPQNLFYQPQSGRISVIDCGALIERNGATDAGRRPPQDIHDFYLEMLKFYTTPQSPPTQARGYRDPYGLRPVTNFERELDDMARLFKDAPDEAVQHAALRLIGQIRQRAYVAFDDFRQDLWVYLEAVGAYHQSLPDLEQAQQVWREALDWLRDDYWQRYLFQPETDLAGLTRL
jgi:hypothetical protein